MNEPEITTQAALGRVDIAPLVFDRPAMMARIEGNIELLKMLLSLSLDELPKNMVDLSIALRNSNVDGVILHAHGIKGGAANVGAMALSDCAGELEKAGKEGHLDIALRLFERVQVEFDRYRVEISAVL